MRYNIFLMLIILLPHFYTNINPYIQPYTLFFDQDMIIESNVTYVSERIFITGNILVKNRGKLTLINTTIFFNNKDVEGFSLIVEPGGKLIIISSKITGPRDKYYTIFIHSNTFFSINYSIIENAGWKDQRDNGQYLWIGPSYTNDKTFFGHGLEVNSTVKIFRYNRFINVASIRFYASNNIVEKNILINVRHEGLAFFGNNNIVRDNVIINGAALKRETYGIRFYPGTRNQAVYNNTIRRITIGIMVANVPPWTAGYNFNVHHNRIFESIHGLLGKFVDAHIYNENYTNIWCLGISIAASKNVLIEKCTITNLTFVNEEILDPKYFEEVKKYIHPKYPRAYFNFLIHLRGGILISWSGRNLTIKDNYISYIPLYGFGISFDVKYIAYNVRIINNTIEHMGDFKPSWNIVNPGLGSVRLDGISGVPPGAAIELESTENIIIEGNRINSALNGILTSFPDAIGNYGNITISRNNITGIFSYIWYEGGRRKTFKGIGIGIGTRAYSPRENSERWKIYSSPALIKICKNSVSNFTYGLVIDIYNQSLKKAYVKENVFKNYLYIKVPTYINISESNILEPFLPDISILYVNLSNTYPKPGEKLKINVTILLTSKIYLTESIIVKTYIGNNVMSRRIILFSGKPANISFIWTAVEGEYNITIIADAYNDVVESNELNNIYSMRIKVSYKKDIFNILHIILLITTIIVLIIIILKFYRD